MSIVLPIIAFLVLMAATLWLRGFLLFRLEKKYSRSGTPGDKILRAIRLPAYVWCFVFSAFLAMFSAEIPPGWREIADRALWTITLAAIAMPLINISLGVIPLFGKTRSISRGNTRLLENLAVIIITILALLSLWYIWDVPASPFKMFIEWLRDNWSFLVVPLLVFVVAIIATFYVRSKGFDALVRYFSRVSWDGDRIILKSIKLPSAVWCIVLSIYLAVVVSAAPPEAKIPTGRALWSLIVISLFIAIVNMAAGLILHYGRKAQVPRRTLLFFRNVARALLLVIMVLVVLEIWSLPTTPILLLIAILVIVLALAFRDAVPNFFASLQLVATQQIKANDYIKLESGEEGYIVEISWINTRIRSFDGKVIIVPNRRLLQRTVVNYGRPVKRASEPFLFNTRTHLTELTGLKAKNVRELAEILRNAPDSVVYFHTHRFLEERHILTPEPSNDFALWASDALGDDVLGEKLASVDTFLFPSIKALRDKLVTIIDEHLAGPHSERDAAEGREFHFMKSVTVLLPTPYSAYDLREFVEAVRKISVGSLFFHMFESKLRLGREHNDFSLWIDKSLGDPELGTEISRIDPYTYTLEGLRLALVQTIEKRIK